jgi:hypothetical protein
VNQPPSELDNKHSIHVCVGNGMRYDVHKAFKERFGIKGVEIFGATEGNCLLFNLDGKYGACGFIPHVHRIITTLPIYM